MLSLKSSIKSYFHRYSNYTPLYRRDASAEKHRKLSTLLLAVVVLSSIFLNAFLVVKALRSWPGPLDDYQTLNTFPVWNGTLPSTLGRHAIVTTLFSDSYAPAVATLGHSLQRANTSARMLVLYFPERVSPAALCLATSSGFVAHPIARIPPPRSGAGMNPHFMDQFTKLSLWSLDSLGIDALVYMDADTLALRNFDEIFSLPYGFAAVPDVFLDSRGFVLDFNAGVLLIKPDSAIYHAMIDALPTARFPPEYAEQAFLNQFFATNAVRLPYIYNGNLAFKKRSPKMWEGIREELRIIHYTIAKPFIGSKFKELSWDTLDARVTEAAQSDGGLFREEMTTWGRMWDETRVAYDQEYSGCSGREF